MSEPASEPPAPPPAAPERKSRWDAPAPDAGKDGEAKADAPAAPVSQADVSEAAAKAAEIAAKIAASLAPPGSTGQEIIMRAKKVEGDFFKDIEINDLRNRYVLTKAHTQKQVR